MVPKTNDTARNFKTILKSSVPQGRRGKHKVFVEKLLSDLQRLNDGDAIKIPLAELPHSKANVRSALNRATRKLGMSVATAVDDGYLYVWNS